MLIAFAVIGDLLAQTGELVEEGELLAFVKEFLRFAGTVEIDPVAAEFLQLGEGGQRTVDEDAGGFFARNDPPQQQLPLLAGRKARLLEAAVQAFAPAHVEGGLDPALVRSLAQERLVRAVARKQAEGAEENGFSRAGFPRHGGEAFLELERNGFQQGEVLDAQELQHVRNFSGPALRGKAGVSRKPALGSRLSVLGSRSRLSVLGSRTTVTREPRPRTESRFSILRLTLPARGKTLRAMADKSTPPMVRRRFGRSGLSMPVFSCGGMRYQDGWQDKPLEEVDPEGQANLEATIRRSVEVGVNHIETARGYGSSERQLGLVLPKFPREDLIVQTKIGPDADPEVFREQFLESLERLQLEHVDLLAIHGINNEEKLLWSIREGGCFDMAARLRAEGKARFLGFATHGPVSIINRAIAFGDDRDDGGFDYVNLHWYYIYQETWPCIEAAAARDMGVFIISPSDKGGQLYKAPPRLHELCAPLHPMTFNDLFCLSHPQVHTLSLGAARPSDFNEHLDALPLLPDARRHLGPILERLRARYEDVVDPLLRDPWHLGLPPIDRIPGRINVGRVVQLHNLARAFDLVDYGKFRYNLLGNAADWFPGEKASPENIGPVRSDLEALFARLPAGKLLMPYLEAAHELLGGQEVRRLSQS